MPRLGILDLNKSGLPVCLLLAVFSAVPLLAQEARLAGTVTDQTGAIVPHATVTAVQTQRGVTFQTSSGETGRYVFPRLPIGPYQVTAEAQGFKSYTQSNVQLTTSAEALLNIALEVGSLAEQITVSAEASRVNAESATVQQLVDSRRILELPLSNRDVYALAKLVPGTGESGTNLNGGRSGSQNSTMVNIRVDGIANVDTSYANILPSPSPDAVQEFTIQTSLPSARYGGASGVIEMSTRSGSNQLHGTLYEFFRNDALDARSFFAPEKSKRRRNQFGGAAGGPVVLPGIYNGRNRTFWFLNLEKQKEPLEALTTITVPTDPQLRGDFSTVGRAIRDPLNNQPFPGNQIPVARLDPLALNFSREYVPRTQDSRGFYVYQRPSDNEPFQMMLRGDQMMGSKHQLSGRVFITRLTSPAGSGNLPAFQAGTLRTDTDLYGATHTWLIAPNMINTARFGLNGFYSDPNYLPKIELSELKKLGFGDFYTYSPDFPLLNVSGFFQASIEQIKVTRDLNTFTWSNDFSWIRGRHNIQIGHDGTRTVQMTPNLSRTNGSFTFNGNLSGLALSDFMLGRPASLRQGNPTGGDLRAVNLNFYLQDDFKVSPRLSLNLGIRYELPLPPHSVKGMAMAYRPGATSQVFPNAPPGLVFPGDAGIGKAGRDTVFDHLAPRFGFSYLLTSDLKTTLRAGYGIYYAQTWSNIESQFTIYQPFQRIIDVVTPPSTANPWQNFPGGNPHPYVPGPQTIFDREITGLAYGPNFTDPMMQQWSLSIQREFARDWLLTVGYAGSRGTHIPYLRDMNAARYIPGQSTVANVNQRRPLYPYFARFSLIESVTNSSYNSLQASLDRRLAKGFTILLSYTFSKALTDLNTVLTNSGAEQDPDNRRAEWGPANFDRTHAFVTSSVYEIPHRGGARSFEKVLTSGWQLTGVWSMYSGAPLTFTLSQDRALRGQPNRPNRISDPRLPLDRPRQELIGEYFNRASFVPNRTGEFGSAPRAEGQLQAPGAIDVTLGVYRNFRGILESHSVQFRAESFNALNRPNFNAPGTNPDSIPTYGRIVGSRDGRIIQLGLKYRF